MFETKQITDVIVAKFAELNKVNTDHAAKVVSENKKFRDRVASILKKNQPTSCAKAGPIPNRVNEEPMWFGEGEHRIKLMTIDASEGASVFGRKVAPYIFKSEKNCRLINERMGVKMNKKGARKATAKELEEIFDEVVRRNFSVDTEAAIDTAIRAGNQYGAKMLGKYPEKSDK